MTILPLVRFFITLVSTPVDKTTLRTHPKFLSKIDCYISLFQFILPLNFGLTELSLHDFDAEPVSIPSILIREASLKRYLVSVCATELKWLLVLSQSISP